MIKRFLVFSLFVFCSVVLFSSCASKEPIKFCGDAPAANQK